MNRSPVRIGSPTRAENGEWIRVSYPVSGLQTDQLWFDVDAEYEDFLTDGCDAAVTSLLILAMQQGRDIVVDGHMSARLWWNLHNTVIPVLRLQNNFTAPIRVRPERFSEASRPTGGAVVTGLSCGVDSFSVTQDHLLAPDLREEDRITHFLFNHLGSHGVTPKEADPRADIRWANVKEAARELGRPVIRVRSNQQDFFGYYPDILIDYERSLTLRNASVPLLLQGGIRRWMMASGMKWIELQVKETHDQAEADPVLLPALSTELVDLVSVGCTYSRVEKTRRVAELAVVQKYLDVCFQPGDGLHNCSKCSKCVRTLLTLDFLGKLEAFHRTFDLSLYHRNRRKHIIEIRAKREGMFRLEIQDLMEEVGYRPTLGIRIQVWTLLAFRALPVRWQEVAQGAWRRATRLGRG